jgi:Formate hydrogenlyase subunit 3/Multisubunit Na+/H+ antiporter, MnhD subunit
MEGAAQYLIAASLGFLAWTTAAWAAEQAALNPGQPLWPTIAFTLIGAAMVLWLGVWPAHRWVPMLFAEGAPIGAAFTVLLIHYGTWFWLAAWAQEFPWLPRLPGWGIVLQALGMLMMGSSALLALAERGWGTIGGYSWLASSGLAWLALSLGTEPGIHLSAWALWVRVVPLLGMAFALAAYRRMAGTTEPGRVSMAQGPWVIGLLLGSGLAMLDAPPFPGFAARWAMTRLLLPAHPLLALGLIGLPGLLGWALLRNLLAREPLDRPLRPMPRAAIGFGIAWWTAELLLLLAAPWLGIPLESLARAWIRTP